MTTKKPYTFRLDEIMMNKLKELAKKENRKLTNFIETLIKKYLDKKK